MVQLKHTSGVNEFHSPVPFLYAFVSVVDQTPGVSFSSDRRRQGSAEEMKLMSRQPSEGNRFL